MGKGLGLPSHGIGFSVTLSNWVDGGYNLMLRIVTAAPANPAIL